MTNRELQEYITRLRKELSDLDTQYTGARPCWVSCDMNLLHERIANAEAALGGSA